MSKELLAQALRDHATWADAYIAEKTRADGLEEQLEAAQSKLAAADTAFRWIADNYPAAMREMPSDIWVDLTSSRRVEGGGVT